MRTRDWVRFLSEVIRILHGHAAISRTAGVTAERVDLLVDDLHHLMVGVDRLRKCHIEIVLTLHGITSAHRIPLQGFRMHGIILKKFRRCAMFEITLITMGKLKEKFYISAAEEYKKRLGGYCKFTLLELPEVRLPRSPQGLKRKRRPFSPRFPRAHGSASSPPRARSCPARNLPRSWQRSSCPANPARAFSSVPPLAWHPGSRRRLISSSPWVP